MTVVPHFRIGFHFTSFMLLQGPGGALFVTTGGFKVCWKCRGSSQKLELIKIELWNWAFFNFQLRQNYFAETKIFCWDKNYALGKRTLRHGNLDEYLQHRHHHDDGTWWWWHYDGDDDDERRVGFYRRQKQNSRQQTHHHFSSSFVYKSGSCGPTVDTPFVSSLGREGGGVLSWPPPLPPSVTTPTLSPRGGAASTLESVPSLLGGGGGTGRWTVPLPVLNGL